MADWRLTSCCGHQQIAFIATVGAFIFVILALWRTPILDPFKLITVFLHEASHATACKLTCGKLFAHTFLLPGYYRSAMYENESTSPFKLAVECGLRNQHSSFWCSVDGALLDHGGDKVEGMEVTADEGGVTHTRGGYQWFILPAGYLGSSFWGMVLVISSTNSITLRIAAALLIISLVVVLIIAKNWFLRFLCLGFITFLIVIWILQETVLKVVRPLRYTILFMGVMNCLFSVYDIYDDLISRRVHSSDAEKFANICPCPCNGVGWGVIWGFISFIFLLASVYLGLVILS